MQAEIAQYQHTLTTLLGPQRDRVSALAGAWLASGANAVSLWCDSVPVACWPDEARPALCGPNALSAPLSMGGKAAWALVIEGDFGPEAGARLEAEAALLSEYLRLECDLEEVTDELVDTQDQLLALYNLTQSARTRVTLDETLLALVAEAAQMLKTESAFIVLAEPGHANMVVQFPGGKYSESELVDLFGALKERGIPLQISEATGDTCLPRGIENAYLIPVQVAKKCIAALGLANRDGSFGSPDIKLARTVAEQVGAQIENMLLYRETLEQAKIHGEMELAAKIQLGLLPKVTPRVAGLEVCGKALPAFRTGGDMFDFISEPERPFLFAVGDVSGKGVSAALGMAMTHAIFQSAARFMPSPNPQKLMHRLNEDLYNDFTEVNMFATMFVGQYTPGSQEILYANAGHSPVLYCPVNGKAQMLEADGTAVGVLPISLSETQTLPFGPGDLLVVATDGFSEASDEAGNMFGYSRLLQMCEEMGDRTAGEIADIFFGAIARHTNGRQQDDDQTLIVIRGVQA